MAANARTAPALSGPTVSLAARLFGLGSVFGKTIRDSRRATIIVAAVVGLIYIVAGKVMTSQYATEEGRKELVNLVQTMPAIMQGLAGRPVNVDTLGGFMNYKYGVFFPLVTGLWSILALSSTLATEMRRGSLEFVAASPVARRKIAFEKILGHAVMVTIAMAFVFVSAAVAGSAFATTPRDDISIAASFGNALWLGLMALMAGSVAFVLAQFVGRAAAVGLAGAIMFAGFILNGYQEAIPQFAPLAQLSWFGWTRNHIPLAGQYDWPSLGLVAAASVVLFALGIEAFARRDVGTTVALPAPQLPRPLLGLGWPLTRAASEQLPTAVAWGTGLGLFGLAIGMSARSFADSFSQSPEITKLFESIFKGFTIGSAGGVLQLLFIQFGFILMGLAAATLIGSWASDETSGRLEMLLATPLLRVRWALASGVGVFVSLGVITLVGAIGIAAGVAGAGQDPTTPIVGSVTLFMFGAAMAGIGFAAGGLFGAGTAAPIVAIVTLVTWAGEVLVRDLGMPDAVHQLALTGHMGLPMLGVWDWPGMAACAVLAVGGLLLGAWGIARRDIAR